MNRTQPCLIVKSVHNNGNYYFSWEIFYSYEVSYYLNIYKSDFIIHMFLTNVMSTHHVKLLHLATV